MRAPHMCRLLVLLPFALAALSCGNDPTPGAFAAGGAEPGTVTVRPRDFVRRIRLTGLTEASTATA